MLREKCVVIGIMCTCMLPIGKAYAQADGSAVCKLDATFQAALRSVDSEDFLREVVSKCKRGDIVAYPSSYTYVVKKTCDFTQQVITTRNEIVCIFFRRPARRSVDNVIVQRSGKIDACRLSS